MVVDRWNTLNVVCIKSINGLKEGNHYRVTGQGDLTYNHDPAVNGRTGCGLCILEERFDYKTFKCLPSQNHFFTLAELEAHFINDEEAYAIHLKQEERNRKLESILHGNS